MVDLYYPLVCRRCGLVYEAMEPRLEEIEFPVCSSCLFLYSTDPDADALGLPPGDIESKER